jgi:hypothetical protein
MENLAAKFSNELAGNVSDESQMQAVETILGAGWVYELPRDRCNPYSPTDIRKRWLVLKTAARRQSFGVCHAAQEYLEHQGSDVPTIAAAIQNSASVGRQFGLLPGGGNVNDSTAFNRIKSDPDSWFIYDSERAQLDFSETAKLQMRPVYARHVGCSALALSVDTTGGNVQVYDAVWKYFCNVYVEDYLIGRTQYVEPTVASPFD